MDLSGALVAQIVAGLRDSGCVFAEEEAQLLISEARSWDELRKMVDKRVEGMPLEYILGWTEFCGLRIIVEDGVFIPRPRTEFLVQQAIDRRPSGRPIIVDLCCGSGAIGLAVATAQSESQLYSVDIDAKAVLCARRNVGARGQVYQGDLYQPLPCAIEGGIDILLANVPYVPTDAIAMMPQEARLYEPSVALDGGPDGLEVLRRVVAKAPLWLAPEGHLFIETSKSQAGRAVAIYSEYGLTSQVIYSEDFDATVVIGWKPGTSTSYQPH